VDGERPPLGIDFPRLGQGGLSAPKRAYIISVFIALQVLVTSGGGLSIHSLYRNNALVTTAWHGDDLVTLPIAVPLLATAWTLAGRGAPRAQLAWLEM